MYRGWKVEVFIGHAPVSTDGVDTGRPRGTRSFLPPS